MLGHMILGRGILPASQGQLPGTTGCLELQFRRPDANCVGAVLKQHYGRLIGKPWSVEFRTRTREVGKGGKPTDPLRRDKQDGVCVWTEAPPLAVWEFTFRLL